MSSTPMPQPSTPPSPLPALTEMAATTIHSNSMEPHRWPCGHRRDEHRTQGIRSPGVKAVSRKAREATSQGPGLHPARDLGRQAPP